MSNDHDATRTAPPEDAATRSAPAASLPSSNATVSLVFPVSGSSATLSAVDGGPPAVHSGVPEVPGYELIEEVGRGAMGVVYKARNLRLNRTVALKMVLGEHVDHRQMIRFLAEAEAVAAVKHPHVVQVFEFGEAGGRPFIAFEYLSGGTLAPRFGAPIPPKVAADLLAKIARGVAAAHDQSIVHRDLKPGNVLFDEAGTPKVADFGLAKRGSVSDLTATYTVMGTPAYMAPEQASGDTKFVGPQADVWALGVILYEASTGSRPFEAADVQGLLARVITADPVPPRKRLSAIPRDLELICLRCLCKQPHERYPTAKELADDLDRYLRGEPISIRPAGPLERGYKWVKRNKVVSGAMAAVTLALLLCSGVSLGFGLEAQKQSQDARRKQKEADDAAAREKGEAARADREKQDAINARNELKGKSDELKRTFAKALLGPITADDRSQSLKRHEVEVLWQLAELRCNEVAWMFLEEAVRTPLTREQLMRRAEYVLHAAIGLDPERRNAAEQLFLVRLRESGNQGSEDITLVLAVARSGLASPETATIAAHRLAGCRSVRLYGHKHTYPDEPIEAVFDVPGLLAVAERMEPAEAARLYASAARALADELADPESFVRKTSSHVEVAKSIAAVAERMEPTEAAAVCTRTARLLSADKEIRMGRQAVSLALLVPLMNPAEVTAVCAPVAHRLADAVVQAQDSALRDNHTKYLAALAARMTPAEAAAICTRAAHGLIDVNAKETNEEIRKSLLQTLAHVIVWIEPAEAARLLRTELAKTSPINPLARQPLIKALVTVTARMEPAEAARILVDVLTKTLTFVDRPFLGLPLAKGLAAVATRLESAKAAEICAQAARCLRGGAGMWLV